MPWGHSLTAIWIRFSAATPTCTVFQNDVLSYSLSFFFRFANDLVNDNLGLRRLVPDLTIGRPTSPEAAAVHNRSCADDARGIRKAVARIMA